VRNALILLVVVALAIVTAGAVNHSVAFDVDWVAGTLRAVSLFWVAAAIALVVVLAGLAAAWLARRGAVRTQRKLEAELDLTYRRVRELEAAAPAVAVPASRATAVAAPIAASTVAAQTPTTEPPAAETTVTVVAAHGSARVTQVLPLPDDPEAGDATAITRMPGDDAGPSSPAEPDAPAAEASAGETASPD